MRDAQRIERLSYLVGMVEREACANICDRLFSDALHQKTHTDEQKLVREVIMKVSKEIYEAILARSNA